MSATAAATTVGIGVIGAGSRICHVLGLMLRHAPSVRVVAVHDPDEASVQLAQAQFGAHVRAEAEVGALVRAPDVHWVFIGSWNCFHREQAIAALEAGKHVFCEKPLAIHLDDIEPMRAAWQCSGCTFALGLVLRYAPFYRELKHLLMAGEIGRVVSFECNETLDPNHGGYIHGNWRREQRYAGSHLLEKCCHDLDLALWLIGSLPVRAASFGGLGFFTPENAAWAKALGPDEAGRPMYQTWPDRARLNPFGGDQDIVDHQVAILEFEDGVRGTFHTNCNAALPERRFYLVGAHGTIRADARTGVIELRRVGHVEEVRRIDLIAGDGHAGGDGAMAEHLAKTVVSGIAPAAGMAEGVAALIACAAIDRAMDTGAVVDLRADWARYGGV